MEIGPLARREPVKLVVLILTLMLMFTAHAKPKKGNGCKEGFTKISCSEVKDAKRDFFCQKDGKETAPDKKEKICKKKRVKGKKKAKKAKKIKETNKSQKPSEE